MDFLMSRVVVLLHGINTRGVWQKTLTPTLAHAGFIPYPLDYGNFRPVKLLSRGARNRKLEWLRSELDTVRRMTRTDRVSVIAHSFGSYLIGELLRRYPEHEFDKLILVGTILDRGFPWTHVLDNWRVGYVRHEYGLLDRWPIWARRAVGGAGDSGSKGFECRHARLCDEPLQLAHSDYFSALHCEKLWLPALRKCYPNPEMSRSVQDRLSVMAQTVAHSLDVNPESLRANVFVEQDEGKLSIPAGFHIGMSDDAETGIRIDIGRGASGRAYQGGRQVVALLRKHWGDNTLPDGQLKLVHKDVKWVISTPIKDLSSRRGFSGVVNVDSIGEDSADEEQLIGVLPQLALHASGFAELLKGISQVADMRE